MNIVKARRQELHTALLKTRMEFEPDGAAEQAEFVVDIGSGSTAHGYSKQQQQAVPQYSTALELGNTAAAARQHTSTAATNSKQHSNTAAGWTLVTQHDKWDHVGVTNY